MMLAWLTSNDSTLMLGLVTLASEGGIGAVRGFMQLNVLTFGRSRAPSVDALLRVGKGATASEGSSAKVAGKLA